MSWYRPWTKLIVKYQNGVAIWLTYSSGVWALEGEYRGPPMDEDRLNTFVQAKIAKIKARMQNRIDSLNAQNIGDKQTIVNNYYANNARTNIDTVLIKRDGKENIDIGNRPTR